MSQLRDYLSKATTLQEYVGTSAATPGSEIPGGGSRFTQTSQELIQNWRELTAQFEALWLDIMTLSPEVYQVALPDLQEFRKLNPRSAEYAMEIFQKLEALISQAAQESDPEKSEGWVVILNRYIEVATRLEYIEQVLDPEQSSADSMPMMSFEEFQSQKNASMFGEEQAIDQAVGMNADSEMAAAAQGPPGEDGEVPPEDGEVPPGEDGEVPPEEGDVPPGEEGEVPPEDGEVPPDEEEVPEEAPPEEEEEEEEPKKPTDESITEAKSHSTLHKSLLGSGFKQISRKKSAGSTTVWYNHPEHGKNQKTSKALGDRAHTAAKAGGLKFLDKPYDGGDSYGTYYHPEFHMSHQVDSDGPEIVVTNFHKNAHGSMKQAGIDEPDTYESVIETVEEHDSDLAFARSKPYTLSRDQDNVITISHKGPEREHHDIGKIRPEVSDQDSPWTRYGAYGQGRYRASPHGHAGDGAFRTHIGPSTQRHHRRHASIEQAADWAHKEHVDGIAKAGKKTSHPDFVKISEPAFKWYTPKQHVYHKATGDHMGSAHDDAGVEEIISKYAGKSKGPSEAYQGLLGDLIFEGCGRVHTAGPNVYYNDIHVGSVGMHKSGKEWGYSHIPDREWKFGFADKDSATKALLTTHDPKFVHDSVSVRDDICDELTEVGPTRGRQDPEIESMVKVVLSDLKSRSGDKKTILDRLHNHWGPKLKSRMHGDQNAVGRVLRLARRKLWGDMAQQESATDDVFDDLIDSCLKEIPKVGKPGDPRPVLTDTDDDDDKFGLSYKAIGKRAADMKSLADIAKDSLGIKPIINYDSPEDYYAGRPKDECGQKCTEGETDDDDDDPYFQSGKLPPLNMSHGEMRRAIDKQKAVADKIAKEPPRHGHNFDNVDPSISSVDPREHLPNWKPKHNRFAVGDEEETDESADKRSTRVATLIRGTPKPAQTSRPDTSSNEAHAQEFVGMAYAGHSATQDKANRLSGLPHAQRHDIARRVRDLKGMMPMGAPPKAEHAHVLNKFLSDHGF